MPITLSPELELLIADEVTDGNFPSSDAVLGACLKLLKSQREFRADIRAGLEQVRVGKVAPFDPSATLARIRAQRQTEDECA